MAMNNIYYRFVHLVHAADYKTLPAKLRMNVMAKPGVDKVDFELWSLAVSAINGCGMCLEATRRCCASTACRPSRSRPRCASPRWCMPSPARSAAEEALAPHVRRLQPGQSGEPCRVTACGPNSGRFFRNRTEHPHVDDHQLTRQVSCTFVSPRAC